MANDTEIRKPAVAGAFYPGDPVQLSKTIAEYFAKSEKKALPGRPIALVSPHAGYAYSGPTAAAAYKQVEGEDYDTVVVISPSHTVFFQGASVFNGDAYQTPLGEIPVDKELSQKIASINRSVFLSNKGHTGGSVRGEHSLEVQLPFLQQVLGRFKLVAIVMGEQEETTSRALGEVLGSALEGENALIVASTDLSHFHPEKEARKLDGHIKKAVEEFNPDRLLGILSSGQGEACGGGPVASALIAARRLGAEDVEITGYTTSGETTGDFDEVVGYLSAVVTSKKKVKKKDVTMGTPAKKKTALDDEDKKFLKDLAYKTIEYRFKKIEFPEVEPPSKEVSANRGAFVTLKTHGMLRGCIGMVRAAKPLYQTVSEMALAAAFEDPRFGPLNDYEFKDIEIEISALTPLQKVEELDEIKVGRDGLMIVMEFHSGLLLPQVAVENGWDRKTFLEQTCLKAGLPKNSFKDKAAKIYKFQAEIF